MTNKTRSEAVSAVVHLHWRGAKITFDRPYVVIDTGAMTFVVPVWDLWWNLPKLSLKEYMDEFEAAFEGAWRSYDRRLLHLWKVERDERDLTEKEAAEVAALESLVQVDGLLWPPAERGPEGETARHRRLVASNLDPGSAN